MRKHYSALGGVAITLALTLTGCGGDDTDPDTNATPTATPETHTSASPTPKTPEEKAAEQLTKYLEVRDTAHRERTINFKTLNPVATGDEFLELQGAVVELTKYEVTKTGNYVHRLDAPRMRGKSVLIVDCEDRSGVTVKVKDKVRTPDYTDPNGDPLRNPVPVEYTLIKDKGAWKVSDSDIKWDESC